MAADKHAASSLNGHGRGEPSASNGHGGQLTADPLYDLCTAEKTSARAWFSIGDCVYRYGLTVGFFYRSLLTEPISLLRFAWRFNNLW